MHVADAARCAVLRRPPRSAGRARREPPRGEAFLGAVRGGELATLLDLLAADAVMRPDLAGRRAGAEPVYDGASALAARFSGGAHGARQAAVDGDPGLAWIVGGGVKAAFVFHIQSRLVREIELIADPEVLTTMSVVPLVEDAKKPVTRVRRIEKVIDTLREQRWSSPRRWCNGDPSKSG